MVVSSCEEKISRFRLEMTIATQPPRRGGLGQGEIWATARELCLGQDPRSNADHALSPALEYAWRKTRRRFGKKKGKCWPVCKQLRQLIERYPHKLRALAGRSGSEPFVRLEKSEFAQRLAVSIVATGACFPLMTM